MTKAEVIRPSQPISPSIVVAVLIVCYNGKVHLEECLGSLKKSADPSIDCRIVVVDNASTDGSAAWVQQRYPAVKVIQSPVNLGFAGGNNLGWDYLQRHHADVRYVALLNQDTIVRPGWLKALVETLENQLDVGAVQGKILLHPRTDLFNSAGNRCHFLGFGYPQAIGQADHGQYDQIRLVQFCSGAAMLVRASLLREHGLFDENLFMYLEDVDLSWRLRMHGHQLLYQPACVVEHKYTFAKNLRYLYFLERNRWWILLVYYRWPTLLLLGPALVLMEVGLHGFAMLRGVWSAKIKACFYFLKPANIRRLRQTRRLVQHHRQITDRQFLKDFSGQVVFPDLHSKVLDWIANPMLAMYWAVARRLIFW